MDDWGSQTSLLISPAMWREYFKPLYKDYCDILRSKNKRVFFHSCGHTEAIFGDLIEIGVEAINTQIFCMNIEELGEKYSGKIVFRGDIDRQHILPFETTDGIRKAVRRVAKALMRRDKNTEMTGIISQCGFGNIDPTENILAVYDEWEKIIDVL